MSPLIGDPVELCCEDCGYTETVVTPPEWLRGEAYACPRCGTHAWALAAAEVTTDGIEAEAVWPADDGDGQPRIIYRSSSPLHPDC